ncbi:glycoside hydrolase superfamily [Myxozyma melibiosi]|uniref:non-reducing end alpha-L-arabinofuranosidase n=1 Tax=Myxozyma melibiosi TaxID=54550 RepID=A0ABR1F4Y1_9ASCO
MAESSRTIAKTDPDAAVIHVDPARVLADIDDKIYCGFLEHLGRCIYGGIVDYDCKIPGLTNDKGFRLDVADAIKDLRMPMIRYPGGNFVSAYHWMDGVGPKENRPVRPELAWRGREPNLFGTDEFMEWCEFMNVEPYLCFNMGTGTLDEALAWLEYCNSDDDTYYANLRRKNGHDKPYNVKYWGLGNEVWNAWVVGQMTAEDYAKKADEWGKVLKMLDPSIILVACGFDGLHTWEYTVTQKLINVCDMYSIHQYTCNYDHIQNVSCTAAAERAIQIVAKLIDLSRITNQASKRTMKIAMDEWNVWDYKRANGENGAEEHYDLSDALAVAAWGNVFVRQAAHLGMANLAQCVNVIAPIMARPDGIFLQTTYHTWKLLSHYMRGKSLALHVGSPMYEGPLDNTHGDIPWLQDIESGIPMLDVSAALNDKKIYLSVVNRSETEAIKTRINLLGEYEEKVHVWSVYHEDVRAKNSFENPTNVGIEEWEYGLGEVKEGVVFREHSYTLLELRLK